MKKNVGFDDNNSAQFIYSDLYQPSLADEYPCFIQIHSEWPVQDVPLHCIMAQNLFTVGIRK